MTEKLDWGKAHEILGVKVGTPLKDVRKAYIRLARKTHPDMPGGSNEAFQRLGEALAVIASGRKSSGDLRFPEFRKEYYELKGQLSPGSIDLGELQEAEVKLTLSKEYADEEKRKRLKMARELLQDQMDMNANFLSRASSGRMRRVHRVLRTDKERLKDRQKERINEIVFKKGIAQVQSDAHRRLAPLVDNVKVIGMKAHVPVVDNVNGRKVVRYALITAGIVAAIMAGHWLFSKSDGAFKPSGLLEAKK